MASQICRSGRVSSRSAVRSLSPCISANPMRCYSPKQQFSTTTTTSSSKSTPESFKIAESEENGGQPAAAGTGAPRWSQTPAGMKAPLQMDFAKHSRNKVWYVNNSPEKLDDMYNKLLGPGGSRMLPDELKWLAVTHKSFDQGRRGFNDRLALMGRLTLVMEATKDIVSSQPKAGSRIEDAFGREPFENDRLRSVDNLIVEAPRDVISKEKLFDLAQRVGLIETVRWKPRSPKNLQGSGVEVVINGALMAIVGAITLQHGSAVASRVVRQQILAKVQKMPGQ